MIKNNLPVILLKGLVLLPLEEARIELNNEISKRIIDIAKKFHDNEILVVTPIDDLEENPDIGDLPVVGVNAIITSRIDLPNGNLRIVLKGIRRVKVLSYTNYENEKDVLGSVVIGYKEEEYDEIEETALHRKLINELEKYISINPYISNSIINQIKGTTDLENLTDKVANFLPLKYNKKLSLMLDMNKITRARKLIRELNVELAILKLEHKIENELKQNLDTMQKDMILKEKIKVIKSELGEKDSKTEYIDKVNEVINSVILPSNIKAKIQSELERYEVTNETSPELAVTRNYIDTLLNIPFGIMTRDEIDIRKVSDRLDKNHYALNDVKERILEHLVLLENSKAIKTPVICLVGPPGVGKTTLAQSIASSLNKNFVKINLGGISDPAELMGHKRTYIGSSPGKIINAIIKAKSMNPVVLLDEIDKLSKDYKGDPAFALLELLDEKNKKFTDSYIEESIDLSKVMWILTANDLTKIPNVLIDRLEIIELSSYLDYEKLNIAKNYLVKDALVNNGINNISIIFTERGIYKIIHDYTKESGVRELNRLINKILRKIITDVKLKKLSIDKHLIVDEEMVKKYLKTEIYKKETTKVVSKGIVNVLACTPYGGEVMTAEVTSFKGNKEFITSGQLGDVLNESIKISLSYIKSNLELFKIDPAKLNQTIHINFREGAIPKDGPSAGISIVTLLLSYLKDKSIDIKTAYTGEITLLGDVLPVGGIKEKAVASIREGITKIFLSTHNKKDVDSLDSYIREKIEFIFVDNYKEIYEYLFNEEG